MKRFGVVLVALTLLFVSPCVSFSQVPGLPSLGDFGALQFGNITVTPSAKIGYRATNLRLNFAVSNPVFAIFPPNWRNLQPLDVTINRADLLVGSIALEIETVLPVFLFSEATGNVSRRIRVTMLQSPWTIPASLVGPRAGEIDWDGSRLQWWLLDFGGGYRLRDNLSVLVGLRIDHFSVALDDPKDPTGTIQLRPGDTLIGDIRTKMWVPYIGVALDGDSYEARIICSPMTSADVRLPLQYVSRGPGFLDDQQAAYTQFKSGWYAGFDAVFKALAVQGFNLNLWASGTYSIIRGSGEGDFELRLLFPSIPLSVTEDLSDQATSTFVTSSFSVGLSADLDF